MATTTDGSKTSRKGPTRSEESKAAILEATRVEMAEMGWRGFSVDSVAKRASASKQTIYRWWPSIGAGRAMPSCAWRFWPLWMTRRPAKSGAPGLAAISVSRCACCSPNSPGKR